jgi:RNA polymerase sigma factor for flagellar operon FliA
MTVSVLDTQQLIEQCQGLVRALAVGIYHKLPPNVDLDDLIAYGQVGLSEAARDFDPSRGIRFSTFAYYRVRGAIYDGMAKMSWFGRSQQAVRYERISNDVLGVQSDESPSTCTEGGETDIRWFRDVSRALAVVYMASHIPVGDDESSGIESSLPDESVGTASAVAMSREMIERLHQLVEKLPPPSRSLIRATYFEGLSIQDAGKRLGISKSWASRLHARTLQELARALQAEGLVE